MLTRQQSRQLGLPLDQEQQLPYNPPTNSFTCDNMSSTHLPNYDGKPGLAFILKHDADRYCADKSANRHSPAAGSLMLRHRRPPIQTNCTAAESALRAAAGDAHP